MTEPNPLLRAAIDYASAGWAIFPCQPRDKRPATAHGVKDATTDPARIRAWWAKMPEANIGLDCGRSGLVVVDLDQHGDKDGLAEWADLTQRAQITDTACHTYTSLTGGGGRHLVYRAPEGVSIKNSTGKLAPGVDVRGEGGYIVLPPSIHPSGNAYQWADADAKIEPLPEALIAPLLAEPDPWKIFTLADAAQPRPTLVWIVDNVLPMNSLSIWYGAPGTLKSMILADLAVCVAGGVRWLTNQQRLAGHTVAPNAVLWLDFDNGQRRTHERFAALAAAHKVPATAPLYYVSMPEPTFDAGNTEALAALAARIVSLNAALVVIDNLGVIIGAADENSASMQEPMKGLRWLVEATGCAVVVLHHQRKSSTTPGTATGRAGDGLRGHGSIEAKLDYAVMVTREDDNLTLTGTKVRGPGFTKLGATFTYENDASHELLTAGFFGFDALAAASDEKSASLEQQIVDALHKQPYLNSNEICKKVTGARAQVMDALRAMCSAKVLGERPGPGISRQLFVING